MKNTVLSKILFALTICCLFFGLGSRAAAQSLANATLPELWDYASQHSAVARTSNAQTELARLQSAAAVANTVNLRGSANLSLTDNYSLPVSFLPAEIFGGPAGTFKQVKFGQQYVNLFTVQPQLDLVNPSTWARVSSAKTSVELTDVTNLLNTRSQFENIATAYYNLKSVDAQREFAQQNLAAADSIVTIVQNRYDAGIARQQDLNNALVNRTNLADFVQQLDIKHASLILTLRSLIGMKEEDGKTIFSLKTSPLPISSESKATSDLLQTQAALQTKLQRSELLAVRLNFLPTLSLVGSFNWQQNSNASMFNSAEWIKSRYVGIKLSVPLPTETRLWSQAEEYRINLKMKQIATDQTKLQEQIQNQQLDLDVDRAQQALASARQVAKLKLENYTRSKANYEEGILSLDLLLTAFTDLLNARLTEYANQWNLELQLTRLALNGIEN